LTFFHGIFGVKTTIIFLVLASFFANAIAAKSSTEASVAKYFETIKNNPRQLAIFLQNMPKGADLHNHMGGASMAENMLRYAHNEHFCIIPKTFTVKNNSRCTAKDALDHLESNTPLYTAIINAWSMQNFIPKNESSHDHFFNTFDKFFPIVAKNRSDILIEIVKRAASQNELYLELMTTPDNNASGMLGKKVGWNNDLSMLREKLLTAGLLPIVKDMIKNIAADEAKLKQSLLCGTHRANAGCYLKIRYLYQVFREQSPAQVFAQLLAGFEAASRDARIVGINMVQPEDGFIAMRDYPLHMKMVGFLHTLYPTVHISLHAGELSPALVPFAGLRFHIRDAIEIAQAERIGHGVSVAYEKNASQLLKEMAQKHILVEINLTSNAEILGIKGDQHSLPLYLRYQVPVALSTDDEGILRTNLTQQYQTVILSYHLSYPTVKQWVRNSISYSFLPGNNLWQDSNYQKIVSSCAQDTLGSNKPSSLCHDFLMQNEKAAMQWELEKRFVIFETNVIHGNFMSQFYNRELPY
jgi:adenosine deaminase